MSDDSDESDDSGVEWFEGWDTNHSCLFYFHRPSGTSQWTKPNAPFVPHTEDDDDDDDDD